MDDTNPTTKAAGTSTNAENTSTNVETMMTETSKSDLQSILADSTHQLLYVDTVHESGRKVHCGDKLLALFVIFVQCVLYLYLTKDAFKGMGEDTLPVKATYYNCDALGDAADDYSIVAEDLECGVNSDGFDAVVITLTVWLFTAFIAADIASSFRLISGSCSAKATGACLLGEFVLAIVCCAAMAGNTINDSGANTVLAAVGVAFIHDLDEKVRLLYTHCSSFKKLVMMIVVILALSTVAGVALFVASGDLKGDFDLEM